MTWALLMAIFTAEARAGLPPGILVAVVMHESGGRWQINHERAGGCSVGPAQVYHADCSERVRRDRDLAAHLDHAARILVRSAKICSRHPRWRACRFPYGLYNAGSSRWARSVERIWRRLAPAPQPEVM